MKKMVCILSALGMLLTAVPAISVSAEETILAGDANQSGDVNVMDLILVNKSILGCEELTKAQIQAVDFNHNKIVDADDSLELLKYIVEITDELPSVQDEPGLQLSASSTVGAAASVPEIIPGFEKAAVPGHDDQTGADFVKHDVTVSPDADAPVGYDTHYAPTWAPEGMMYRAQIFDHTDETSKDICKYSIQFTPIYFEGENHLHGFRFEQQTEADFSRTLIEQDPAYLESLSGKNHDEESTHVITINGNPGFYTQTDSYRGSTCKSSYVLVWKQDGYVMQLSHDDPISLEDLVKVAESVRPRKIVSPADSAAASPEEFNFVESPSASGGTVWEETTVTPVPGAPTGYDRIFRITEIPENVRLESTCDYFSYTELGQQGDIECRSTTYNVQTKDGMKNITLYVQTQKDFYFLFSIGDSSFTTSRNETYSRNFVKEEITIKDHPAFCYRYTVGEGTDNEKTSYIPCWIQDGYVMFMSDSCHFTKEEVIKIAESVAEERSE